MNMDEMDHNTTEDSCSSLMSVFSCVTMLLLVILAASAVILAHTPGSIRYSGKSLAPCSMGLAKKIALQHHISLAVPQASMTYITSG